MQGGLPCCDGHSARHPFGVTCCLCLEWRVLRTDTGVMDKATEFGKVRATCATRINNENPEGDE